MGTYAFADTQCAIAGPGGRFSLGAGSGSGEEGITFEPTGDKNTMQIGADGRGQHSMHSDQSGTVTITLLKTSPVNAQLMNLLNFQRTSAAYWGQNVISIANPISGDTASATQVAFKKWPKIAYAKEAGTNEWTFDAINIDPRLGSGGPKF